ncbi:uncharacterized protein [Acropora muricata]|uniref:uncharacterized protein n=1 Tax=Acropora muricata TaxID=159855 RepID=UPI0034E492A1
MRNTGQGGLLKTICPKMFFDFQTDKLQNFCIGSYFTALGLTRKVLSNGCYQCFWSPQQLLIFESVIWLSLDCLQKVMSKFVLQDGQPETDHGVEWPPIFSL